MIKKNIINILRLLIYVFPLFSFIAGTIYSHITGAASAGININLIDKKITMMLCLLTLILFVAEVAAANIIQEKYGNLKAILMIVLVSIIIRLIVIVLIPAQQESDFDVYYRMGLSLANGDISSSRKIMEDFGLNSLSGLAVINGFISLVSGRTLKGFEAAQAVIQCGSIICVYYICNSLNNKISIIASSLYSVYPSAVFSVLITTNQHLATFFFLSSILVFYRAVNMDEEISAKVIRVLTAGALLALSYYSHPSTLAILAAIVSACLLVCLNNYKLFKSLFFYTILLLISYHLTISIGDVLLIHSGITSTKSENGSMLGKFVVGLNYETTGQAASPYKGYINEYDLLNNIPENRVDIYMRNIIKERVNNQDLPLLIVRKDKVMWHAPDNFFIFVTRASNLATSSSGGTPVSDNLFQVKIIESAKKTDYYFLMIIYFLASVGLLLSCFKTSEVSNADDYLPLVLCLCLDAWIFIFMFIEIQPRYRYEMMGIVFIYAAISIRYILNLIFNLNLKYLPRFVERLFR